MNPNEISQKRPKLDPVDVPWAESVRKRVWNSNPICQMLLNPGEEEPPTIFRVPDNIHESDPKAYDPCVLSLGPFNHRTPECSSASQIMQKDKWKRVLFLVSRHNSRIRAKLLLNECLAAMKNLECKARRCYSGVLAKEMSSSDEFSQMLLLDGCFILHFLLRQVEKNNLEVVVPEENTRNKTHKEEVQTEQEQEEEDDDDEDIVLLQCPEVTEMLEAGGVWIWSIIKYDLLKLENQIPFFVIQTLFDLLKTPDDVGVDLVDVALQFLGTFNPHRVGPLQDPIHPHQVCHLLHLYHLSLRPCESHDEPRDAEDKRGSEGWIPSATELRESGVKFKTKFDARSFLDITFSNGVMEIPKLNICKYSDSIFRNLMAFEQCFPVWPYITNYAMFMDCILHGGTRDVRFLHLKGIIMNRQSSDNEAACFFNHLCKQIHYGSEINYLRRLYADVTRYTDSRWNRWRASLMREYFSSPWMIMSVVAAILLILLTVSQSFFAAFSYFFPPR